MGNKNAKLIAHVIDEKLDELGMNMKLTQSLNKKKWDQVKKLCNFIFLIGERNTC